MNKIQSFYPCSLMLINDLIGGKWKQRILWHISKGDNRFSLLQKAIPDISTKMLTTQLRELESSSLVIKKDFKTLPLHVEYSICEEHQDIVIILDALCNFSKQYATIRGVFVEE